MLKCSFYSYKGGSGRSTTAWNTIQRLTLIESLKPSAQEPFIIVDTDTESAGSTFLYGAKNVFRDNEGKLSIQRRIAEKQKVYKKSSSPEEKADFFEGMFPIGKYFGLEDEKSVLLIGVNLNKETAEGVTGKDDSQARNFADMIRACDACGAKAIFFDTPSGTQFLAKKSVIESKIVVCCMRPTSQFLTSTKDQLIDFISKEDPESTIKKTYILTPTAICVDKEQRFDDFDYPKTAKDKINTEFNTISELLSLDMLKTTPEELKIYKSNEAPEDNELVFGIPEVKRFKWFEDCLGCMKDVKNSNDKMAINRYQYLAFLINKFYAE